jgi:hypothetical protein
VVLEDLDREVIEHGRAGGERRPDRLIRRLVLPGDDLLQDKLDRRDPARRLLDDLLQVGLADPQLMDRVE